MRIALAALALFAAAEAAAEPCTTGAVDEKAFLCAAAAGPSGDVGDILLRLPPRFRKNFTLKHGARRTGPRGHVQDAVGDSPSAHPGGPRVLVWDETTGFSITYDGNPPRPDASERARRGARRLGMLSVDPATHAFSLSAIELPSRLTPHQPAHADDACQACHGPDSRPIWPMYPDWPGFIGSDNDELSRDTDGQREELGWLREARRLPRLAPLFDLDAYLAELFAGIDRDAVRAHLRTRPKPTAGLRAAAGGDDATLRKWLGLVVHERFPYRANHELQLAEASRALFHRPNSRAGMLFNRLQARWLMTRIRKSPLYARQPALVALTVMDCGSASGERMPYPALLAALGLSVRDVDIRLAYRSAEYDRFDRAQAAPALARTVMDLGYIEYPGGPAKLHGATHFWSSYFDGSASLDELLALAMLEELGDPALAALYQPMSLAEKYREVSARYAIDRPFFAEMDRLGRWFPLPYPEHLAPVHHRDPFSAKRAREERYRFPAQYRAVCEHLRQRLRKP